MLICTRYLIFSFTTFLSVIHLLETIDVLKILVQYPSIRGIEVQKRFFCTQPKYISIVSKICKIRREVKTKKYYLLQYNVMSVEKFRFQVPYSN